MNKVLIIDDEEAILKSLKLALKPYFIVETLSDADNTLNIISEINPACILLDIKMPKVNGIDLLKEIKNSHPNLPVLIMSGHTDNTVEDKVIKLGASIYLNKPLDLFNLIEQINNIISK